MKVTIGTIDEFERRARRLAKKYKSLKGDLRDLQQELMENPLQGSDLGGGVRKIRMAIGSKGKGKSSGARVLTLTILVSDDADVTLLTIFLYKFLSNKKFFDARSGKAERLRILPCQIFHLP